MRNYLNTMTETAFRAVVLVIFVVIFLVTLFLMAGAQGHAAQIESPDREVKRVQVTYSEWVGSHRYPNRHYFETNDGATYRYKGYRACANAHEVAPRICRTVFSYAR